MKSISSFGSNNQNPINDREGLNNNNNNYQANYLAKDNARDEVSFSGNKKEGIKAKGFKGLLIALAATMGLSGWTPAINNKDVNASSMPETAITETADDINEPQLQTNEGQVTLLDLDSNVPVVSIVSTKKVDNEEVEVKRFPNALAIKDDMFRVAGPVGCKRRKPVVVRSVNDRVPPVPSVWRCVCWRRPQSRICAARRNISVSPRRKGFG